MLIEIRYLSPLLSVCSNVNFLFSFTFPLIKLHVIIFLINTVGLIAINFKTRPSPRLWLAFGRRRRFNVGSRNLPLLFKLRVKSFVVKV